MMLTEARGDAIISSLEEHRDELDGLLTDNVMERVEGFMFNHNITSGS